MVGYRVNFTFTQKGWLNQIFRYVMICCTIIHIVLKLYDSCVLLQYGIYVPSGLGYEISENCYIMVLYFETSFPEFHTKLSETFVK
jgi:hypothetical protein